VLRDAPFGCAHQIEGLPFGIAHLLKNRFARYAAIHHPHSPRFAIGGFDLRQKTAQRGTIRSVAVHHFIRQGKAVRCHHQCDHQLHAVRSSIAAVAALRFGILLHFPFEVRAGQIVKQNFEISAEQIGPFLLQVHEQFLLVLEHAVQTSVQPILLRHFEARLQQLIHSGVCVPLAMHAKFAAGVEQAVDDQQPQHLFPTYRYTAFGQALSPKLIQTQLLPEFTREPAVAEDARAFQFQAAQTNLYAVDRVGGKLAVIGKQTHRGETLFGFIEYVERLSPRGLLPVINLAEVEHGALRGLTAGQPTILNHAEVTMIFAVFAPVCAAKKHLSAAACQRSKAQKRGKVFT